MQTPNPTLNTMRKNTLAVIKAFQSHKSKGIFGTSISTDGETIYCYTTPIYNRITGLNTQKYSVTTTRQQNAIRLALCQ